MNRDDIEKLLGGHAAGTLTPAEREALYMAALEDQQLFESLAGEEPLRELLQDSAVRAQLLAALDERPAPWYRRFSRPALGLAAGAAMVLMAVFVRYEPPKPEPVVVAETRREPVRSFQPPLPVEKAPLPTALQLKPTALPPPPELPAPVASAVPLQAIPPAAPAAPPAPPAAEQQALAAPSKAAADSESAKANLPVLPAAPTPSFQRLDLTAQQAAAASASDLGLRYTVYRKSTSGELTAVDPQAELDRGDEVVIRFESSAAGLLSVSRLDVSNSPRVIANARLAPSVPYTVPETGSLRANETGTNVLVVRFSRQPQSAQQRVAVAGQAGAAPARSAGAEPAVQQGTFNITLKYK